MSVTEEVLIIVGICNPQTLADLGITFVEGASDQAVLGDDDHDHDDATSSASMVSRYSRRERDRYRQIFSLQAVLRQRVFPKCSICMEGKLW